MTKYTADRLLSFQYSLMDGNFANVESVVITYQSLTFVCFQSGGILLNRNTFSTMPDLRVGDTNGLKRKDTDFSEDEAMKRLRTANMQHDDQDTPVPILDLAQWQNHVPQQGVSLFQTSLPVESTYSLNVLLSCVSSPLAR